MRYSNDRYVEVDSAVINEAVRRSGLDKGKLSTMLLNKNQSYISQSLSRGSFNIVELKRLCEFLGIEVDSVIKKSEPPLVVPEKSAETSDLGAKVETCIIGMGTLYEEQKKVTDLLSQMLVELKALNAKQNRLENALGQLVQNSIITKENVGKVLDVQNHLKSQANIISGRTRDLVQVFQKGGKS